MTANIILGSPKVIYKILGNIMAEGGFDNAEELELQNRNQEYYEDYEDYDIDDLLAERDKLVEVQRGIRHMRTHANE